MQRLFLLLSGSLCTFVTQIWNGYLASLFNFFTWYKREHFRITFIINHIAFFFVFLHEITHTISDRIILFIYCILLPRLPVGRHRHYPKKYVVDVDVLYKIVVLDFTLLSILLAGHLIGNFRYFLTPWATSTLGIPLRYNTYSGNWLIQTAISVKPDKNMLSKFFYITRKGPRYYP